jgi:hypothetical protein
LTTGIFLGRTRRLFIGTDRLCLLIGLAIFLGLRFFGDDFFDLGLSGDFESVRNFGYFGLDDRFGFGFGLDTAAADYRGTPGAQHALLLDLPLAGSPDPTQLLANEFDLFVLERGGRASEFNPEGSHLLDELTLLDSQLFRELVCPDLCHAYCVARSIQLRRT